MKKRIEKLKGKLNLVWPMAAIWIFVFGICVVAFFVAEPMSGGALLMPNFRIISLIIAFATFVMTTLFSFLILSHNITTRKANADSAKSAEEFRVLQFVSSNYSVVEFFGEMLLYEQYSTYTKELERTKDFAFFLRQEDIDLADVAENFDDYAFLSVRLPFRVVEGKSIAGLRVTRFRFAREANKYVFVPCSCDMNTLILYDDAIKSSIMLAGLIIKKGGDFLMSDKVTPFGKIKLNLSMRSLLGVEVSGWTELYFTNPRKLAKDGANTYEITSTQFKISGLPILVKESSADV